MNCYVCLVLLCLRCFANDCNDQVAHRAPIRELSKSYDQFVEDFGDKQLPSGVQVALKTPIFFLFRVGHDGHAIMAPNVNQDADRTIDSVKSGNCFIGDVKPNSEGAYDFAWIQTLSDGKKYFIRLRVDKHFVYRFEIPSSDVCKMANQTNLLIDFMNGLIQPNVRH